MPRHKSYDRLQSVERACHIFWEKGYRTLGVRALQRETGLNQFAIRTEFGGKEGLYLEALAFYSASAQTIVMPPMRSGGLNSIIEFFEQLVTEGSPISSKWGCLMVNTGIENAEIGSEKLELAVQRYWSSLAEHFETALLQSRKAGDLETSLDITDVSNGLVTAVMGIHTQNRSAGAHDAGQPMTDIICNYLNALRIK